ncbi:MAG: hypothetical protein LBF93_11535 [Zoogloeaceae bacterium]|jgi:hypothetical protein|nr:hypothetical protein [Zoogloeaceae bacterium]
MKTTAEQRSLFSLAKWVAILLLGVLAWQQWQQGRQWRQLAAERPGIMSRHMTQEATSDWRANPRGGLQGCVYTAADESVALGLAGAAPCPQEQAGKRFDIRLGRFLDNQLAKMSTPPLMANPDIMESITGGKPPVAMLGKGSRQRPVTRGANIGMTIHAPSQHRAQMLLACMTGRDEEACRSLRIDKARWSGFFENAAARGISLIQVDLESGAIEVLASAVSPCFEAEANKAGIAGSARLPAHCPRLPHMSAAMAQSHTDGYALHRAPPGSVNKAWLALGLLRAGRYDPRKDEALLYTSDTRTFIDRLLCAKQGFAFPCAALETLPQAAKDLGLNTAPRNLGLAGVNVPAGRIYQRPARTWRNGGWAWRDPPFEDITNADIPPAVAKACREQNWSRCRGERLAEVTAEFWGRGNSETSIVNVAEMYVRLGRAANGKKDFVPLHLIREIEGETVSPQAEKLPLSRGHAEAILAALQKTATAQRPDTGQKTAPLQGTAFSTCRYVLGKRCGTIVDLAMKTGTPGFADLMHMTDRFARCSNAKKPSDCRNVPYKWAVALTRRGKGRHARYDKAIVVLGERNWRRNGYIDASPRAGGQREGLNVAAEVIFHLLLIEENTKGKRPSP